MLLRRPLLPLVLLLAFVAFSPPAAGQPDGEPVPVTVVTKEAPPFAMKGEDGAWTGLAVELWQGVAEDLGLETTWREMTLEGMVDALSSGEADAAVAALSVTAEREEAFDFSQPFYPTGLGMAVRGERRSTFAAVLSAIFSAGFAKAVLSLVGVLLLVGVVVWLFERRRNKEQFGGGVSQGIGSGLWWSAVTMTTVGYGDKAPATLGGRLVGFVWMFASMLIVATFTGAIASALTISELESDIQGPEDLPGRVVGTVRGSASEDWLRTERIRRRGYDDLRTALDALAAGRVDAVVYDRPLLRWRLKEGGERYASLTVLPRKFEEQAYAFGLAHGRALPDGTELREAVNRALLRRLREPSWIEAQDRYLGQ